MMTHENARLTYLEMLLEPWPEYRVVGNRPYAKGCYLIRRARVVDGLYMPPEVVFATDRNYDMKLVMEHPDFHPARAAAVATAAVRQRHSSSHPKGLLDAEVAPDYRLIRRELCAKAIELLTEGLNLASLFLDEVALASQSTAASTVELRRVWRYELGPAPKPRKARK